MTPRPDTPRQWPWPLRAGFRFAFAYLLLYNLPFPLNALPGAGAVDGAWLWRGLVGWVGRVLGVDTSVLPNGSGDTAFNYVQVLCMGALSAAAAAVWSALDRGRQHHRPLHELLRAYVRWSLAAVLIVYGSIKVIPSQFPAPGLDRMFEPMGEASPMGMMWTFMGLSRGYNLFLGLAELTAGALLVLRRTTLLGALLSFAIFTNILVMNLCFDVPVKLFSAHLLAMSAFLSLPDTDRLVRLLVLQREVPRPPPPAEWLPPRLRRAAPLLALVFFGHWTAQSLVEASRSLRQRAPGEGTWPLYGAWEPVSFSREGGAEVAADDPRRWQRVIFASRSSVALQTPGGYRRLRARFDEGRRVVVLSLVYDPAFRAELGYERLGPDSLRVEGDFEGSRVRAELRRVPLPGFVLTSRPFRWVSDYPYNR